MLNQQLSVENLRLQDSIRQIFTASEEVIFGTINFVELLEDSYQTAKCLAQQSHTYDHITKKRFEELCRRETYEESSVIKVKIVKTQGLLLGLMAVEIVQIDKYVACRQNNCHIRVRQLGSYFLRFSYKYVYIYISFNDVIGVQYLINNLIHINTQIRGDLLCRKGFFCVTATLCRMRLSFQIAAPLLLSLLGIRLVYFYFIGSKVSLLILFSNRIEPIWAKNLFAFVCLMLC